MYPQPFLLISLHASQQPGIKLRWCIGYNTGFSLMPADLVNAIEGSVTYAPATLMEFRLGFIAVDDEVGADDRRW